MIIKFDFKISMTLKRGDSGQAMEKYGDKAVDDLAGHLESKK